ncbi:MAG: NlpC/P60 family protein [Ferruginibacter sp.]
MKHLFFVAVASGIFSGTTISVNAQSNANIERSAGRAQPKILPKFIEDIEIVPAATNTVVMVVDEKATTNPSVNVQPPSTPKTGFYGSIELCSRLQFKYATMMNTEVENITNFSLYNFIDKWWATRYQYGGKDSTGIDCSAFTGRLLSEVYGLNVPRIAKDQYKTCEKLAIGELVEGDLVFFNTRGGVSHVGLYLGNNYFVHCSVHDGVTISSLEEEYYNRKFIAGGRVIHNNPDTASLTVQ